MNTNIVLTDELTPAEIGLLQDLEYRIKQGLATFLEVGAALARIRDDHLYRATHSTFEKYVSDRWGMSRSYAHRQIAAAEICQTLPIGNKPTHETQVRPLTALPPAEQPAAWSAAVERAEATNSSKVTEKIVRTVVAERAKPPGRLAVLETAIERGKATADEVLDAIQEREALVARLTVAHELPEPINLALGLLDQSVRRLEDQLPNLSATDKVLITPILLDLWPRLSHVLLAVVNPGPATRRSMTQEVARMADVLRSTES